MRLVRVVDYGPERRVEIVWERVEMKGMPFHTLVVEYAEEGAGQLPRILSIGAPSLDVVVTSTYGLLAKLVMEMVDHPEVMDTLVSLREPIGTLLMQAVHANASVVEPGLN